MLDYPCADRAAAEFAGRALPLRWDDPALYSVSGRHKLAAIGWCFMVVPGVGCLVSLLVGHR